MRVSDEVAVWRKASSEEEEIKSVGLGEKNWDSECERERRCGSEVERGDMCGGRRGSSSE
jgi:hypothetical protein